MNTSTLITDYFLTDALGSVRQLTDASGAITYARAYDPYGVVTSTSGASLTAYGFTGEQQSNNLVYLRSRMYAPGTGRFLTRDTWGGDVNSPMSLNRWNYTNDNPINYTDSTGYSACNPFSSSNCGWLFVWNLGGWPPVELVYVPCDNQTQQQPWMYSTPTGTPLPYTQTPSPIQITPQTTPTATTTPAPQYERVTAYRGLKKTSPSAIKPRIDAPEKELAAMGAVGSFSVFENLPLGGDFKYRLPFEITYKTPKNPGRIGTVVGVVSGEQIFSGGVAVYSPLGNGEGHWSITVIGLSEEELKNRVVEYGVKYFGNK